ncbi:MAG TPA: hypothetical protein VFE27_12010 [Acidobacteriaceae bacterium]|nr:hypothetical protein [Acidobacteriaceae bacterium]
MPCDKLKIFDKSATAALRVLLAGAMLSLSPLGALAADAHIHASFAGVYVTRAPKTAPTMSVSLGEDGSATVTQDPGQGSTTLFGRWQDDGRQIKVTFTATEGEPVPAPMVFEPAHGKLQAISWDHEAWGTTQPPAMTKGYKVKYLFWTTTMR